LTNLDKIIVVRSTAKLVLESKGLAHPNGMTSRQRFLAAGGNDLPPGSEERFPFFDQLNKLLGDSFVQGGVQRGKSRSKVIFNSLLPPSCEQNEFFNAGCTGLLHAMLNQGLNARMGSISFEMDFVAGKKRVPAPPTGNYSCFKWMS